MVLGFISALAGGVLIGLAAAIVLITHGRIAGVSGTLGGALAAPTADAGRWLFLAGLVAGGVVLRLLAPAAFSATLDSSPLVLVAGGLLVGVGTQLGRGCTSGHGVCGIGRGSPRSLLATITFMLTGAAAVYVLKHVVTPVVTP